MSNSPISEQLAPLLNVQKIDIRLGELSNLQATWTEKIEEAESRKLVLTDQLDLLVEKRTELLKERDRLMLEAQEETDRILTYEKHIREIKNNREYQALVREVGVSKKAKFDAEETALGIMQEAESLEGEIATVKEQVAEIDAELDELQQQADQAAQDSDGEVKVLNSEREGMLKEISVEIVSRYNLVRKRQENVIVPAAAQACTGCQRKLPPQLYNQVLQDLALISCPFCHRLLTPPVAEDAPQDDTPDA